MVGFLKEMFIALLSPYTTGRFSGPLASNSEGRIKCVLLSNRSR